MTGRKPKLTAEQRAEVKKAEAHLRAVRQRLPA